MISSANYKTGQLRCHRTTTSSVLYSSTQILQKTVRELRFPVLNGKRTRITKFQEIQLGRSRNRVYDPDYPYFITSSIVEGYPLFAIPTATQILLDALLFLQEKRDTKLYAYVIMENHIHMVLQSDELSSKMQAFKSWTARAIIDLFSDNGHYLHLSKLRKAKNPSHTDSVHQFWQEGYHPKHIYGNRMMIQKIEYIHQNPVKRGYVDREEDWRYSSARNYMGLDSLIPVTLFEL